MTEFLKPEVKIDSSITGRPTNEDRKGRAFLAFTGSERAQQEATNPKSEPKESLDNDSISTNDLVVALLGKEGIDLVLAPDGKLNIVLDPKELGGIEELLRSLIRENRRIKGQLRSDRDNREANLRHSEGLEEELRKAKEENDKLRDEIQGLRGTIRAIEQILRKPPSTEGLTLINGQEKGKESIPVLGQDIPTLSTLIKGDESDQEKKFKLFDHDIELDNLLRRWLEKLDQSLIRRIGNNEFEEIKRKQGRDFRFIKINVLKENQPAYPMLRASPDLEELRIKEDIITGFQEGKTPEIYLIEDSGSYNYYIVLPRNS